MKWGNPDNRPLVLSWGGGSGGAILSSGRAFGECPQTFLVVIMAAASVVSTWVPL